MKKLLITILSILTSCVLFSQNYQWQSAINQTDSTSFYKVELQPEIIAKLQHNFSDIRIKNEKGVELPYFIEKEEFSVTQRVFNEYKIIEKIKWKNGATVLFIENKKGATINNLQLQIKNFDVRKRLELAGSDDYTDWYTIKENYLFYNADGNHTTSEVKGLNFPYSDYKYYRIIIYDVFSLPINVLKVGYYDTYQEQGKFKALQQPTLLRVDSLKQTYIKVDFNEAPYFDKLVFKIDKPMYYNRNARICLKHADKKGRIYFETLHYFTLNSNSELTFYQAKFSYQQFYVIIDNEDNPPLEQIEILPFQLNHYLVTHLEMSTNYNIVFGSDKVQQQPNYDITFFKNKIGEAPIIQTKQIESIQQQVKTKKEQSTYWIWLAIGIVAVFLGYMSYNMITEMEKK